MNIWAIADLHLAFANPEKSMEAFGWHHYTEKIQEQWQKYIQPEDIVLIAGDISWAMSINGAKQDLEWIDSLHGTKLLIRGNHDYWWSSLKKMQKQLPSSLIAIHNSGYENDSITVTGTRLWDSLEFSFSEDTKTLSQEEKINCDKIFQRELNRLKIGLNTLDQTGKKKIVMTHYPPLGLDLKTSSASSLLEEFKVDHCVFGHLHHLDKTQSYFGQARGVYYHLTSADYLNFTPKLITSI